jgi:hypothetical protein
MNILIVVMTMLMLMAILTYSRLESYRSFAVLKREFIHYMQESEREAINTQAINLYETTTGSENGPQNKTRVNAPPQIPLYLLVNKNERDAHPKEFGLIKQITKRLIEYLYKDAPFYKKLETVRPGFVDDLLQAIMHAADNLPEGKKITYITDLSNLELGDEQLDDAFYHMIKENKLAPQEIEPTSDTQTIALDEGKAGEEQEETEGEDPPYSSPSGYFSLYSYTTLSKSSKIRVFLAPYPVLMVLFNEDPGAVQSIIDLRQKLYAEVVSRAQISESNTASASAEFKRFVIAKADPHLHELIDATVTKTNPKKYNQ